MHFGCTCTCVHMQCTCMYMYMYTQHQRGSDCIVFHNYHLITQVYNQCYTECNCSADQLHRACMWTVSQTTEFWFCAYIVHSLHRCGTNLHVPHHVLYMYMYNDVYIVHTCVCHCCGDGWHVYLINAHLCSTQLMVFHFLTSSTTPYTVHVPQCWSTL